MGTALWIDGLAYAARLLRDGEAPWTSPDDLARFCGEAAGLLSAQRLFLPIAPLIAAHWQPDMDDPETSAESFDEAVAGGDLVEQVQRSFAVLSGTGQLGTLVPVFPGAGRLLGTEADDDAIDLMVTGLGDLIRAIGSHQPAMIAYDEPSPAAQAEAGALFRIAAHMGCPMALLDAQDHDDAAICFAAPGAGVGKAGGATLCEAEFSAGAVPSGTENLRVEIPADAQPEAVLARLTELAAA